MANGNASGRAGKRHGKVSLLFLALAVVSLLSALAVSVGFVPSREAAAATASLSFQPSAGVVAAGDELDVTILQTADVPTSGVEVDVVFACGLLEVVDVKPGPAYTPGSVLVGVAPQTKAQAIADASRLGVIRNLGSFKAPGAANVGAGPALVLIITFRARAGFSGTSPLRLADTEVLDAVGVPVPVINSEGSVQVTGTGPTLTATPTFTATTTATPTETATITPSPTGTPLDETETPTATPPNVCEASAPVPTATPTVTMTPAPTNTALPAGCNPTPTPTYTFTSTPLAHTNTPEPPTPTHTNTPTPSLSATLQVRPASVSVPPGTDVVLELVQNAPVGAAGIQTDVTFDHTLLQVVAIEIGSAYADAGGQLIYPDATAALTYASDCTGLIENVGVSVTPGEVPSGELVAFILKIKARAGVTGISAVQLSDAHITTPDDSFGTKMQVTVSNGEVKVDPNAPTPTPTATATLESAAATAAALQTAQAVSSVAGTTSGSSGSNPATGLPNAGAWFGEDGSRSLILGISAVTLVTSLIALANTWIRRRKT